VARTTASAQISSFLRSITFPQRTRQINIVTSAATAQRIERSRLLEAAGLDEFASMELAYAARTADQPLAATLALATLETKRSYPERALRFIKRYAPGYLNVPIESAQSEFWRLAFPLPYRETLEKRAKEQELDPFLVAALIRQESEFDARVVSHANAYGLTQVLPSTGRELARRLGIRGFRAAMLFQPDFNLQMGTHYLKSLFTQLDSRWEATLAAYNAGKTRAVAWLQWYDYREPAEFVESIPFNETRNYVQTVIRNADIYRRLYGGNKPG
jgi:soluble lytic murein transglycosylase